MTKKRAFSTEAIHISKTFGEKGSLNVPIYQNSTFAQKTPGTWEEYTYTRTKNPTEEALRHALARLEGGEYSVAFSSGLAAINALLEYFNAGDHIISGADVYGGTYRLFAEFVRKRGIEIDFVETKELSKIERALKPNTKLIFTETPSNPLLEITDIKAVCKLAQQRGILVAVDNTMATPFFQRPLELGADIVVQSLSKYISGHTNVIGGAVIAKDKELLDRIQFIHKATGANPGPFDTYLTLLGLKTLPLRMERHQQNAFAVAEFLGAHPKVTKVLYPGLKEHPQHALASEQMSGFGGIVSFFIDGGEAEAKKLIEGIDLFTISISFGSVASFISYPAKMSHKDMPAAERISRGFTDSLVRVSVGTEAEEDILEALGNALNKLG
ncbi:MAG: PLP-dependent transferase [Bdellovibrionales bacterium]|nr:PLP-dependent transferase [Bdellovibrionales bacterium]